jgi:transposase
MPPQYVKAYVKTNKHDAADAEACCEAVQRPGMRFVATKSEEQHAALMLHRVRDLLIAERTAAINALRGHLAEFGLVAVQLQTGLRELRPPSAMSTTIGFPRSHARCCRHWSRIFVTSSDGS